MVHSICNVGVEGIFHPRNYVSRFGTHALYVQIQQPLVWTCTAGEILLYATSHNILLLPPQFLSLLQRTICPASAASNVYVSPLFLLGTALVIFGSLLRLTCFRKLGSLFTFDLTIFPSHKLVTTGPYACVRHPSYTGTLAICAGLALAHLTPGSWAVECGMFGRGGAPGAVLRTICASAWYAWWVAVGVVRCRTEDEELRKKFGAEWEAYARAVRWWMMPGVL